MYITGEKSLQTIWDDLILEFEEEIQQIQKGQSRESIGRNRFCRMRPDISFRLPTETKVGVFYILEFKRMSDVTDKYLVKQITVISGVRSLNEQDLREKTSSSSKSRKRA